MKSIFKSLETGVPMALFSVKMKKKLLILTLLSTLSSGVFALTSAGEKILNQAVMTYFDPETQTTYEILSNISTVQVGVVYAVNLTPDTTADEKTEFRSVPGSFINVPHTVTNTGNVEDTYIIEVENLPNDNGDLYTSGQSEINIFIDVNGNGIKDPGEPELPKDTNGRYLIEELLPSGTIALVFTVSIPTNATNANFYDFNTEVTSTSEDTVTDSTETRLIVTNGAALNLNIDSNLECYDDAFPLTEIDFTVNYSSTGSTAPDEGSEPYQVFVKSETTDEYIETSVSGVLITANIPANVSLLTDKTSNGSPLRDYSPITISSPETNFEGGIVLVGVNSDSLINPKPSELDWYDYATWDGTDSVYQVGFLVKSSYMRPGMSGSFSYYTQVNDVYFLNPLTVYSQASVTLSQTQEEVIQSNQICHTLASESDTGSGITNIDFESISSSIFTSGTDFTIDYSDEDHFEETEFYYHREIDNFDSQFDGIHVSLTLPQANEFSELIDIIGPANSSYPIILRSDLGDNFHWVFAETGPNTGIFRSVIPIHAVLEDDSTTRDVDNHCLENVIEQWLTGARTRTELLAFIDGTINFSDYGLDGFTAEDCELQVVPNENIYVDVYNESGSIILSDEALISPTITVFDSNSLEGVENSVVSFFQDDGLDVVANANANANTRGVQNSIRLVSANTTNGLTPIVTATADADGNVYFPKLVTSDGEHYFVTVEPPDSHSWPSSNTDTTQFTEFNVASGSYGLNGNQGVTNSGIEPVETLSYFDIPIDPLSSSTNLVLQKEADVTESEIGSFVRYTVTITNLQTDSSVFDTYVYDAMPYGFKYMEGSARLNGVAIEDPNFVSGLTYQFNLGTLSSSTTSPDFGVYTLTYILQLTAGAVDSDGINTAYADGALSATDLTSRLVSNTDSFQVGITQTGVLSDRGIIFGKVFINTECHVDSANQLWPIGGVKLYLENGDYVITDENGQYSLFGVKPGNHVIKVDTQTLPEGINLAPMDTRNAGVGDSRFVDIKHGDMFRADFSAPCPTKDQEKIFKELKERNANINGEWLIDTAENFKGLESTNTQKALSSAEFGSGIVSGPKNATNSTSTGNFSTRFKGYALQATKGSLAGVEKILATYPKHVQEEAYIYLEQGDVYSLRVGFSDLKDNLLPLKEALEKNKIDTKVIATEYSKLPEAAKLRIDNELDNPIPLPEKAVKNITREEAKTGTWYWPTDEYSYDGRFIVVARGSVTPYLYVNNEKISDSHLGERIINNREKAQILGWYGVKLNHGSNLVEVKATDMFGNERILLSKTFYHPTSANRISISVDPDDTLYADGGRSVIPVSIKLFDENNNLARGSYFVTLDTDKGNPWLEPDIQPSETGYQVRVNNGEKRVHLRSTDESSEITIDAFFEQNTDKIKIHQVAAKRPLFVTGILNYTGRYGKANGMMPSAQADGYENKKYSDEERAALFLKGNVKGGMHLTLSYDSDKEDEAFFREISPDAYYPLPGDASIRGYDARSTSKLYAKLEKERSFILWGDYNTSDGSNTADLGRTSQILNGANAVYNDGRLMLQTYGARPKDLHKVIEFPGNGTAMLYNIGAQDIVRNSDSVALITYDRNNPGLILSEQPLSRYIDYTINYFSGDMRFNRVIPGFDTDFNPIVVRVSFDVGSDGDAYTLAGARISHLLTPSLQVGGSYELNDNDIEGYQLGSVWTNYNLDNKTKITASVARMSHKGNQSAQSLGMPSTEPLDDGMAYKLSIQRDWTANISTELEYAYAEKGFTNSTGGISADRQEIRLRHRQKITSFVNLNIEANRSNSLEIKDEQESVGVTLDTKLLGTQWTTRIGSRYIANETETTKEEFTTAIAGLGRSFSLFGRPGRIDSEYEQSFNRDEQRRYKLKTDWQVHQQASIYAQYEHIDSLNGISDLGSGSTNLFAGGINVDWVNGGSSYNEFRQRGGSDGRSLELANGYRDRFEIQEGISIDPAIEYIEVLDGAGESGVAVSLGVADVRDPNYKTTGRVEYRHGNLDDYYGLLGAWITRLNLDWSGLVREEFRYLDSKNEADTWESHFSLGAAYRPRLTNRYDMLVAYEWKTEQSDINRHAHILSTHQNYKAMPKLTLSGRLGVKWENFSEYSEDYDSTATILDGRAIYYLDRRWDIDINAGVLGTDWLDSRRYSFGFGLNYLVMRNLRAGIGYNFVGFDDKDLDPQGYNLQGINFDIMFKLDEDLFGWLSE